MATRIFVRSFFRIALARCLRLGFNLKGELRFFLFLHRLTGNSLLEVEPIALGLFFSTELSVGGTAVDLIGESQLPSPGCLATFRAAVAIEVMHGLKIPFARLVQTQTLPDS